MHNAPRYIVWISEPIAGGVYHHMLTLEQAQWLKETAVGKGREAVVYEPIKEQTGGTK